MDAVRPCPIAMPLSSSDGYTALTAGGAGGALLDDDDDDGVPRLDDGDAAMAMEDDATQAYLDTESDDEEYLQEAGWDDSYRPAGSSTAADSHSHCQLVVGGVVLVVALLLLVLLFTASTYGDALRANVRAASFSWPTVLLPVLPSIHAASYHGSPQVSPSDFIAASTATSRLTASSSSAPPSLPSSSTTLLSSLLLSSSSSSAASAAAGSAASSSLLHDKSARPALLAHLSSYVARHYSPNMTLQPDRHYIVFTPTDDGLGNKLLPLVSSFLLALILDRTWLVQWVGTEAVHNSKVHIEEVFRPPDGMDWSWPDIVDRTKRALNKQDAVGDQHSLFRTELCDVAVALSLSCSVVDMAGADMGGPGHENVVDKVGLSCEDWRSEGRHTASLLVNWGDQYYVPQLQVNAAYRPFITSLFDEDDIFGPLARFLLRPSAAVQSYLSDMQQRFWTGRYVVSMQMRRKERLGLRNQEVDTAVMCAQRLAAEGRAATGKDVTFFVASDDAALRDSLVSRMLPDGQVVHVANFSIREAQNGVFFAAVDVLLLSRGDAIVTTPSSTFGYASAGFGSLVPWRVQLSPGRDCSRAVNSEPSSHFFHAMVAYSKSQSFCVDPSQFPHLLQQETCCPRW